MAYATISELLDRMGLSDATNTALVTRLTSALNAATTAIDNDTGRTFDSTVGTKEFGAVNAYDLRVPDLVSVTTLKIDTTDDGTFDTTIDAADFELDTESTVTGWPYEIIRLLATSYPSGGRRRRRIEVVGSWGWSAVPDPINQACTLLAGRVAQRTSSALFGVQGFGDLGAMTIRRDDPDYRRLIGPYTYAQVA